MTATPLHFEPRPWTSPCSVCGDPLSEDHTATLATESGDAVCDGCAEKLDPMMGRALKVLRQVDNAWWRITSRGVWFDSSRVPDANAYLAHVAAGIAALAEYYRPDREPDLPPSSAASR